MQPLKQAGIRFCSVISRDVILGEGRLTGAVQRGPWVPNHPAQTWRYVGMPAQASHLLAHTRFPRILWTVTATVARVCLCEEGFIRLCGCFPYSIVRTSLC